MSNNIYSVITGTGKYIPKQQIKNEDFLTNEFYSKDGVLLDKTNQEIIDKFSEITTINSRQYITDDLTTSDIAYFSAIEAIKSAKIEKLEKVKHHGLVTYKFESGLEITATQDHPFRIQTKSQ